MAAARRRLRVEIEKAINTYSVHISPAYNDNGKRQLLLFPFCAPPYRPAIYNIITI